MAEAWLGRRVVAHLGLASGGYAELAVTGAERLHEIPWPLGFAAAVAMIGTGRTALGITGFAEPGPDDVVVPAAAGGIGTLLVRYAATAGATVAGLTGGEAKTERVRANGADLAVDRTAPGRAAEVRAGLGGRAATIVYDGVGGAVARDAVALLGPGGRHLVLGWSAEGIGEGRGYAVAGVSESVLGPEPTRRGGGLRALEERALAEAARGRPRPAVTRFPLARAAAAHRAPGTGHRAPRTAHRRTAAPWGRWCWNPEKSLRNRVEAPRCDTSRSMVFWPDEHRPNG